MVEEQTMLLKGGVLVTVDPVISNFGGAYFNIITEHNISIQNQITDNYLENNTAVQDHIAQSPITVSVSGIVAQLSYTPSELQRERVLEKTKQETALSPIDKLSQLSVLLPPVDNAMQVSRNVNDYVEASVNRYVGVWKSLNNSNNPDFGADIRGKEQINKLKEVFSKFLDLRNANAAFTVETPFETFKNMYIQTLTFRQGNENYVGDISITLKQLRFAEVETTEADKDVMAKYNAYTRAKEENNGKAQGKQVSNSILYKTFTPGFEYNNR